MKKVTSFFKGIADWLLAAEEGSIIWAIQQIWYFIKALWKAASERLNSISEDRQAQKQEERDS